jgi:hypothetical protein
MDQTQLSRRALFSQAADNGRAPARVTKAAAAGAGPEQLVEELRLYQIELDAQNLALRETQATLEGALARYADPPFTPLAPPCGRRGAGGVAPGADCLKLAAGRPQDVADVKRLEEMTRG